MLIFGLRGGVRKLLLASVAFEDLPKYCLANKQQQQWKMRNTKSGDTTRRAFCRWYLCYLYLHIYLWYLLHMLQ